MIIVKLQGGLGNQMFQYAAARSLAKTGNIYLDRSFLKQNNISTEGFTARRFELSIFKKLHARQLSGITSYVINSKNIVFRAIKKMCFPGMIYVHDTDAVGSVAARSFYLDGYFQNENHFKQNRTKLLDDFTFPTLEGNDAAWLQKIANATNPVSIHVRRGDYLKQQVSEYHGVLDAGYYQQAVGLIDSKVDAPTYFIISDDTPWCKNTFGYLTDRAHFVTTTTRDWADMKLMSLCKHHIIANSSFSWWGAWLNNHAGKIVIAPKKWFNGATNNNVVPDSWIKI